MSMYPNSAYMPNPPAPAASQGNMINGTPHPMSMQSTMQQQQQQILQQKQQLQQQQQHLQQQQQATMPPSLNSSSINKFLPPAAAALPPTSSAMAPPPPSNLSMPQTRPANFAPPQQQQQQQQQHQANGTNFPPTQSTQAPTHLANNLPPYLRPPPGGVNGIHSNNSQLTNGGSGASEASANSSRTASPALQNALPPTSSALYQQQRQQQLGTTAMTSPSQLPPPSSFPQGQQTTKYVATSTATAAATTSTVPSNVGPLTESMHNMNINQQKSAQNILQRQQQQQPPPMMPPTSNSAALSNNLHKNFKTTALNPPQQQQPSAAFQAPPTSSVANSQYSASIQQPYMQMPPPPPPTNVSEQPLTSPPTNAPMYAQPPAAVGQKPMPPPPTTAAISRPLQTAYQQNAINANNMMTAPPSSATQQQNQFNNNQQPNVAAAVAPPPPLTQSMQRRPMYPPTNALPPLPTQASSAIQQQQPQQQQQQPYAQIYQHQQQQQQLPPTQPGMFNGQHNTGPLQYQSQQTMPQASSQYAPSPQGGVLQQGFNRLWGQDTIDLMQNRHILTPNTMMPPKVVLHNQFQESVNCNPYIMRCTIAKIPESNSLLQKSRLPLGIVIHPFRDINSLPVIQCPNIVRCRLCRTYINPFVYFVDSKMWKCNLCYRTNELPEDFQFDPATKTYGDVTRRPEVRSSTIEFIAPSEYMLRPPPPAMYLFLFDVSIIAQQCGYLENVCATLSKHLEDMPGDARTQVGFIAFNSQVHFYSMAEGYNQPHEMTLLDIDDPFLPRPDNLLVNLKECKELVKDLLTQLPKRFADTHDPGSALGAALQVAYKLMQASGGRVTVFQTCLPNKGPGSLEAREDPNNRSAKDIAHLNPATDFYKRYALDSSGYQIAVDLFLLNQQYSDLATISGVSKHSGGCVHHFPLYQKTKPQHVESLKQCFKRYLTRKIGFEAVMRIRCTRGLQVHTFHGNFFVRSTDLLSLPNVNPDAGYGMQISYEETLSDVKTICFQAALLYTNSEGERRIRVHTLCLPVTASLPEIMHAADAEAIIGLLSKMAVDRSLTSNVADAREAFLNATIDIFNAFKVAQNLPTGQSGQLIAPRSLALLPLYILALLKHRAFRVGTSTRLDDRVFAMDCMKTLPLDQLMKYIYPEFYQIDVLFYKTQNPNAVGNSNVTEDDEEEDYLPEVPRLQLSAEFLDSRATFLLDCGTLIIIYVGLNVPAKILDNVFGVKSTAELPDYCYGLPNVSSPENDALRRFIMRLNEDKPYAPTVQIIRDTSTAKPEFIEKLVDDRTESSFSYYEFLQHIRAQVK